MSQSLSHAAPADARTDDETELRQRDGGQTMPVGRVSAPNPDSARAQTVRDGNRQARLVVEALQAAQPQSAAGGSAPAVQSVYGRVDMNAANIYTAGPVMQAIVDYEGTGARLGGDGSAVPRPAHILEYARANNIAPTDVYHQLVLEQAAQLQSADDQYHELVRSHATATENLRAASTGKRPLLVPTLLLGITTFGLAVSTAIVSYLLLSKGGANNGGGTPTATGGTPLQVNPYKQGGFVAGVPAIADVLYYDGGMDRTTIAIVNADPKTRTLTVPHEGAWSIDSAYRVIFTPFTDFFGNPTPQQYSVASTDGATSASALITLVYDGDFRIDSIIQTTFAKGMAATIPFLAGAIGADPNSAALVDADPNSHGLVRTVAGEGVWTLDRTARTITFDPTPAGFKGEPSEIGFSVSDTNATRTAHPFIILVDQHPSVPNMVQKAKPGQSFTVAGLAVPGAVLDAASLRIETPSGQATALTVAKQGQWSIDAGGVLSFAPAAGFEDLPDPITLSIADTLGRRSSSFTLTAVVFTPPYALNAFTLLPTPLAQMGGTSVVCEGATTAIRGDFRIDPGSVRIPGLLPFDNALPTASYVTQDKEMRVTGEGDWKANADGTITFVFDAAPARWPTPIGYTVRDTDGNESNLGMAWIVPPEMADVEVALAGVGNADDDTFWTKYHDDILAKQVSLGELIAATFLLERSATLAVLSSMKPSDLMLIDAVVVIDPATVNRTATSWAATYKASPTNLPDVTAFIDNAYVDAAAAAANLKTKVGSAVPLATRILRLRMIRALLHTIMT